MPHTPHNPRPLENLLLRNADQAIRANIRCYEGVFAAGDVWVAGELDGFDAAAVYTLVFLRPVFTVV